MSAYFRVIGNLYRYEPTHLDSLEAANDLAEFGRSRGDETHVEFCDDRELEKVVSVMVEPVTAEIEIL